MYIVNDSGAHAIKPRVPGHLPFHLSPLWVESTNMTLPIQYDVIWLSTPLSPSSERSNKGCSNIEQENCPPSPLT